MHQYTLQPYKGMWSRYTCPQCLKHKVFTRYINTTTEEHLADHVGRCSRENNCGYHFKPADYFKSATNNSTDFSRDAHLWLTKKKPAALPANNPMLIGNIIKNNNLLQPKKAPATQADFIHPDIVNASFNVKEYAQNNFVQYLIMLFGFDKADELVGRYRIGTSKHWPGAVIFWQIDAAGKVRTGKIMLYNRDTGKRVKEPFNHITWAHCLLSGKFEVINPESKPANGFRLKTPGFALRQCLFGEHLLTESPGAPVAIVESEKTAIIASAMLPGLVWLAAGSLTNLNERMCKVLQYRQVLLFPDLMAYDKWKAKATLLQRALPGTTFRVFRELERLANDDEKSKGLDIGDLAGR